jgi:pimeloyl-ACP methyl ester carboxylesterase
MDTWEARHEGLRIAGKTRGRGEAILFIHADFVDSRMWKGTMELLSGNWKCSAYDKIGYGASEKAKGPICRRKELAAVLDAMGGGRVHLVGCSNGGQQALDYALERPERVRSLCLVNSPPSGFIPQGEPPAELLEMLRASAAGKMEEASELQTRIWFDGPRRKAESFRGDAAKARALAKEMNGIFVKNGTFAIADMQPLEPLAPPAIQRLGELKIPVLVLSGALDYEENRRASRILAEGIAGARFEEMEGFAHVPPLEDPRGFSAVLEGFLTSLA